MRQQKSELHSRECFPEQKYDRKSLGMETRGWKCDEGQPYLSFDLCDRHRTYLCRPSANKPKSRPARSSVTAVVCLTDQPHSARPGTARQMPDQSQRSPMPPLQEVRRGWSILGQLSLREVGEVNAFLAPPPATNCQPRARNSVPGKPHWP